LRPSRCLPPLVTYFVFHYNTDNAKAAAHFFHRIPFPAGIDKSAKKKALDKQGPNEGQLQLTVAL
ncbi:hypothetical protein, partial [Acidaminococcus timonensis]|uniref:hypothetical protein n=1 Tax=Acidaminococcus timonensis TaxID=1871002 RepID=UPI003080D157